MWSAGCILGEIILGKPIFPGTSTLNQVEKVVKVIGHPKGEDVAAINSNLAGSLLDGIKKASYTGFRDFQSKTCRDGMDLLKKMLTFNPNKRITIEQALKHP